MVREGDLGASSTSESRATAGRSTSGSSRDRGLVTGRIDGGVRRTHRTDVRVRLRRPGPRHRGRAIVTIADDGGDDLAGPQEPPSRVGGRGRAGVPARSRRALQLVHAEVGGGIVDVDIDARASRDRVAERRGDRRRLHGGGRARPDRARPHRRTPAEVRAIVEVGRDRCEIGGTTPATTPAVVTSGVEGGGPGRRSSTSPGRPRRAPRSRPRALPCHRTGAWWRP